MKILVHVIEMYQLFPLSFLILFAHLIWTARALFRELDQRAQQNLLTTNNGVNPFQRWREEHILVCDFVDEINDCFGQFLGYLIGSNFISFIDIGFKIPSCIREDNVSCVINFGGISFKHIIQLSIIIVSAYLMQSQVRRQ